MMPSPAGFNVLTHLAQNQCSWTDVTKSVIRTPFQIITISQIPKLYIEHGRDDFVLLINQWESDATSEFNQGFKARPQFKSINQCYKPWRTITRKDGQKKRQNQHEPWTEVVLISK